MEKVVKPVDRDTLYEEVWTEPVAVVAPRYGLSDVGLAKICRKLRIPIPSRGYWAKVKAGRIMKRIPLPKLAPALATAPAQVLEKLSDTELDQRKKTQEAVARVRQEVHGFMDKLKDAVEHRLVQAARLRLRRRDTWPADTLLPTPAKYDINISVTRESVERALRLADSLLAALLKQGMTCELDSERGLTLLVWKETGTALEFSLTEHVRRSRHEVAAAEERARKRYWDSVLHSHARTHDAPNIPMYDYTATGILTLQVGRWPSKSWKDTPKKTLEERLPEVVAGVLALAHETYGKAQEDARREAAFLRAKERYEFLTERRASEEERLKEVEASASNLERANRLRALANAYEQRAAAASELSQQHRDWLEWVRAKADWLDPLIQVSDPILDAPAPKKPTRW